MNRFRQLKQRLIKGKRDSQKVQISPSNQLQNPPILFPTNYELQQWVQNQLQYYGISPSSYRLRQLKHFFDRRQSESKSAQNLISQPQEQIYRQQRQFKKVSSEKISQQQKMSSQESTNTKQQNKQLIEIKTGLQQQSRKQSTSFSSVNTKRKLIQKKAHQNTQNSQSSIIIEDQERIITNPLSKQHHCSFRSQQNNNEIIENISDKKQNNISNTIKNKIICKRNTNYQTSSLNKMSQMKESQDGIVRDFLLSCQGNNPSQQVKQLDYYTLILQLTVQLNYSRVNRQTNNQKSILKQLKNLICYIEEESKLNSGLNASNTKSPLLLSSQKSCHTFSSIHSNASLMSMQNQEDFPTDTSPKRRIQLSNSQSQRFSVNSINLTDNKFNQKEYNKSVSSQIDQCLLSEEQHNQTFKSISIFQDLNESQSERNNITAVDISNENQQQQNIILIEQSESETNIIIENTPLSRITEHQSQYTMSCQPSLKDSPSKFSQKFATGKSNLSQNSLFDQQLSDSQHSSLDSEHPPFDFPSLDPKSIQLKLFSQQQMKNKKKDLKEVMSSPNFLPENELILKKLSDKHESTQQHQNPFEQSLQYKRILYMLDTEYAACDFKTRTPSRIGPQSPSPSFPFNQSSSQKSSLSLYYIKNQPDLSAKSFNKQVFDSNQQTQHNHHTHAPNQHCLMDNLESLFNKHSTKHVKSPQRLTFNPSGQNTPLQSQRFKKHQRSKTSLINNQGLNKTKKYRLNLLSQLSYQINEQSEQNAYDVNKYLRSKNQSQDDSVYHKVSRNSYLTSSSPNSKVTSSQSEFESGISMIKKENLIVKKNKLKTTCKNQTISNQKKTSLIVKKQKKKKTQQDNSSNHTQRLLKQNKENYQYEDNDSNLSSAQRKQFQKEQSFSKSRLEASFHYRRCDISNIKSDLSNIDIVSSQVDSKDEGLSNNGDDSRSSEGCYRPIKYKVYTREHQQPVRGKQDKRKVLQDIVSILNSKYNKNIQLNE